MRIVKGYTVCQAVRKEFGGVKAFSTPKFDAIAFFPTKDDARAYLADVLELRKAEIAKGDREEWNLDPEKCLDFLITKAELFADESKMKDRGWTIE